MIECLTNTLRFSLTRMHSLDQQSVCYSNWKVSRIKLEISSRHLMKGLQCIETVEAHNPVLIMTKQAYSNWLKIPQEILNGIDSVWFTWRKKERFQKRREFLFMCWLNKVQVNDMEKQFWKSSIYQHYSIRDVMRLPINRVSHYFSLSTSLCSITTYVHMNENIVVP